ncbi:hypothetical protein BH09BAC2_BH09BAC2_09390 [soil metagenome]
MKVEQLYSNKKIIVKLLLLIMPLVVIASFVLWRVDQYFSVLGSQWMSHSIYFAAGSICGLLFYTKRFRFISTIIALLIVFWLLYRIINNTFTGEFSAFYASANFYIFSILFLIGWLTGWGFARLRYFPVLLSVVLLVVQIILVSKTTDITAQKLILAFTPVLLFSFYIIYTAELIRNMSDEETAMGWFILKRMLMFVTLAGVLLIFIFMFLKTDFKAIEKEFGGAGKQEKEDGKESLTKQNKDGTISNKDKMGLSGGAKSTKRLVFIAKLDNYFPNSETPNPLYFTYTYYSKFDTLTQTLEIDSLMPSNDAYHPDPSKIPLYFTDTDSTVLQKAKGFLKRKVVTAEVYKALLSPKDFLAPSTSFFCQPISVEKEYKEQFKSAYRAKMYVSELNSAYFIYNPAGNTMLEDFQKQRFDELRNVISWAGEDQVFMNYYTFMPAGTEYDSIRTLAASITKNAQTPVDKVIAIRDYFLSLDDNGQPLYKYSDNPGVPGLPSANKLNYFLFENRKGYCAYFAGATLFLLRSLGLPSRVATGFLTVDRSDKNKGWYWYYEDQAHAWVQVYFPGYGWIDFDTTVPSTEQQESPAPDGTPPITVQSAYFVTNGKLTSIDTVSKKAEMDVTKMIFKDKVYDLSKPYHLKMDISLASVNNDTGSVPLSALKQGITITALSFSEQFKNIISSASDSASDIFSKIPVHTPIDEIKIIEPEESKPKKQQLNKVKPVNFYRILWIALIVFGTLIVLLFALPWIIYRWLRFNAFRKNTILKKGYYVYTSSMYLLNQFGFERGNLTPLQFTKTKIDNDFKTDFTSFMNVYLKTKYSTQPLTENEENSIQTFYRPFEKMVTRSIPFKQRFLSFINFYRTINYFIKPKI